MKKYLKSICIIFVILLAIMLIIWQRKEFEVRKTVLIVPTENEIKVDEKEVISLKEEIKEDYLSPETKPNSETDLLEEETKEETKEEIKEETKEKKKENEAPKEDKKPINPINTTDTNTDEKVVYLTFDDGPSKNTEKILDILDEYNVKATFFVIGGTSDFYKKVIKDISDRGNVVGNHTYSHDYKYIYKSVENFYADLKKSEDNLYEILGYRPEIIRFPGGSNNTVSHQYGGSDIMKKIIEDLDKEKYQYFDWNVSSSDAQIVTQDKDVIIDAVKSGIKSKKNIIILFHDSSSKTTTVEALPTIIEHLQEKGYEFKVLNKDSYTVQFQK